MHECIALHYAIFGGLPRLSGPRRSHFVCLRVPEGQFVSSGLLWRPESFTRWASGLSSSSLESDDKGWKAQGPEGPIRVVFTEHNSLGVMDHWVDLGDGRIVYVPLRIIPNEDGSEVMLTLFRQPGMSSEKFTEDEAWVRRDLVALKAFAEEESRP